MRKKTLLLMSGAAVAGIYGAVTGKGPFNKIRFREQHERISNYVDTHYPKSIYSPVTATKKGYVTTVRRLGQPPIILYITVDEDGNYIFTENEISQS